MSETFEATDNSLIGLTGRKLKIGSDWENKNGKWRLGIKAAYELFPSALVSRLKSERKKEWEKKQLERSASLQASLAKFDEANTSPKGEKKRERRRRRDCSNLIDMQSGCSSIRVHTLAKASSRGCLAEAIGHCDQKLSNIFQNM